jgi:hypothetical protein
MDVLMLPLSGFLLTTSAAKPNVSLPPKLRGAIRSRKVLSVHLPLVLLARCFTLGLKDYDTNH